MDHEQLLRIKGKPIKFDGTLRLPASKSYLHRALFTAALSDGSSKISDCGSTLSDDVQATLRVLKKLGVKIQGNNEANGSIMVVPNWTGRKKVTVYVKGSGTTARLAIAFASLAPKGVETKLSGDESLSKRPMQEILDALSALGVSCYSEKRNGCLPVIVRGGGISGGECTVDGSISSQFISALLISCTKAKEDCTIRIKNPEKLVSRPYIEATLLVLGQFGYNVKVLSSKRFEYVGFIVKSNQSGKGRVFRVPGDMSAAAALIGAATAAKGRLQLLGANLDLPQSDSIFLSIARKLGGAIKMNGSSILVEGTNPKKGLINLNLKDAPDLVPAVAGLAAGAGCDVRISNVAHLRFKESDRLHTLATELAKLGVKTHETASSLSVLAKSKKESLRKPILLDPQSDHRMLMAFTIAGLSGRFGEILISDPGCVAKSYPSFVSDLQRACGEKVTVSLVKRA